MATDLATDTRARVINDLADGIGPILSAIDELQAAARSRDKARVAAAGRRLFAVRDSYLDPIVERIRNGEEL